MSRRGLGGRQMERTGSASASSGPQLFAGKDLSVCLNDSKAVPRKYKEV
jgi:hypothetical protein